MTKKTKGKILKYSAIGIDAGVPFVATLFQFPMWIEQSSEATISGLFLVFAFLSALPFLRQIKEYMKSPSAPVVWGVLWALFVFLQNIIRQMAFVCLFGFIANIIGAALYKAGASLEKGDEL